MSQFAIRQYQAEVEKIIHYGGTAKESAISHAFCNLLNEYAKAKGLMMVPQVTIKAANGKNIMPDGTLKDTLRQDWGYWESKDESDKIDEEIKRKFDKGYPKYNILFEDSQTAVLIQNGNEVQRVSMNDADALDRLLIAFISFERPEVKNFRTAIELFKQDIPKVTETIRGIIVEQEKTNKKFNEAGAVFLKLCHDSINPNVTTEDVREMIIQHILTEDLFNTIFDETQFHRENNIAHQLEQVIDTFFTGATRRTALSTIQHYYEAINAAAHGIADHHEKQMFLKVVYETFYKSYNPKAADRLGVVYTPNEIVNFMIASTDYLLNKHFGKLLEDKGVEILDPATGTGTFVCDIIDYLRKERLEYKYTNEINANEVAILPYYISNLNIEFTYKQKMGQYKEFENLCFVDTLDNMGFKYRGKQIDMFAPFTEENSVRIKRQNDKKISVVIGNPPYNANQANENENNKNREYPEIDKRIKDTFIKYSTAQKTKVYDMYARFYRWAFDRLDNNGVIAFVTNRSFIDSRTFDGFRKCVQDEFDYAYIIDTKSDVRANPKIAGTTHNVFGIQAGVAIMFLVKKQKRDNTSCNIKYIALDDFWRKEQKLQWLSENQISQIPFEHITPDKNNNWIGADSDFLSMLELINRETKSNTKRENAVFKMTSLGLVTARDWWVYDFDSKSVETKVRFLIDVYNRDLSKYKGKEKNEIKDLVDYSIKWSRAVKNDLQKGKEYQFMQKDIVDCMYRPYTKKKVYFNRQLNEMQYQLNQIYRNGQSNPTICVTAHSQVPFCVQASLNLFDYGYGARDTKSLSLYNYDTNGNRIDNITDWGLNKFIKQYGKKGLSKEAIFYYVYAVLHNPAYSKKYELNLKREFPRIPFYEDFKKWSQWGKELMDLHINYEAVKPFGLKEVTTDSKDAPKAKLKADKEAGNIILDENTTLTGVLSEAWQYKLGNRSALEWVLDQYKEKKPSDPTIAGRFNTYHFADYKDKVIDLLKRVCTVSVETIKIIQRMPKE